MRIKSLTAAAAALAMVAAPVAASANPAPVAGSVRASSESGSNELAGGNGFIIAFVLAAMFAAALILPDALEDSPNSP